jgi:hypothetical protein
MSSSEQIHRLESELEIHKHDLRNDAAQISDKIEQTKAELSPTNFIRDRPGLSLALAAILGVALYFVLNRRELPVEEVARPSLEK